MPACQTFDYKIEDRADAIARMLDGFQNLQASVCCNKEQMAITVIVPPPWSSAAEATALQAQSEIKEWSKQQPEMVCYCFDSFSTLLYVLS